MTANELFGEPTEDEANCEHPLMTMLTKPPLSAEAQLEMDCLDYLAKHAPGFRFV